MGATQISINRGMDKENAVLLYIMKYYSAIKQNEKKKKKPFAATRMDPEIAI